MAKTKDAKWLASYMKAAHSRAKWAQTDESKNNRLGGMKNEIDELADEIKFLSTYKIDVKGFLFDKTIRSMNEDQGTWDPNSEIDTGRDVSKMKEAIPKEVMDRLMAAQNRIIGMQAALQSPISRGEWPQVRQEFADSVSDRITDFSKQNNGPPSPADMKTIREEVAEELAVKFKCGADEILQIELEGALSDEHGELPWKQIKDEMKKSTDRADEADEKLEKLKKQLKASGSKPDSVREKLGKQIQDQQDACQAAHQAVEDKKTELAGKHAHGEVFRIEEIVAWKPVFSDIELRLELWKPLMRSGAIADNTIPDAYNETVQVFRGASDLYNARGEREAPDEGAKDTALSALKNSKHLLDKTSQMANAVVAAAGGPEIVGTVITAIDVIGGALLSGATSVIEKDIDTVFDSVGDLLGEACSLALGNAALASIIESSYAAGAHGGKAIAKLVQSKGKDWQGVLNELAEGVAASLCAVGDSDKSLGIFTTAGKDLETAIKSIDLGAAIAKAFESDPPDTEAIVDAFAEACDSAIQSEMQTVSQLQDQARDTQKEEAKQEIDNDTSLSEQEKQSRKDAIDQEFENLDASAENIESDEQTAHSQNVKNIKQGNDKLFEKVKKNLEAQEKRKTDEEIENEIDNFKAELAMGFGSGDGGALETALDFTALDRMIAQINRDRALLKMAEAIFDTGVKTAAEFFEPLKMASSGKDFVKNLIMAVRRALELKEWVELKEDALKAASVQGFAFANRVRNLKVQVSKRTLDAIYELAQLVGAATSCSGIASGAGIAVSKGAKALQILTELTYEYAQKAELKRQWRKYKRCLENPYDRSAMRDCLHGNPTLSKFAMAYGAVVENDAIAMEGMRKCGINEASLRHPSTDCDKVVTYLETKFNDDPTLVRRLKKQSWQVGEVELSVSSWLTNKETAQKKVHFSPVGSGVIDLALAKVESTKEAFEKGLETIPEHRDAFAKGFDAYGPIAEKYKKAFSDFNRAKTAFDDLKKKATLELQTYDKTAPAKRKPAAVVSVIKRLDEALATNKSLVEKADATNATLTEFGDAVDPFKVAAEKYLKILTEPRFVKDYTASLEALIGALKAYKPLASGAQGEPLQPSEEMASYLDGLVAKAEIALASVKREAKEFDRTRDEVEEQQGEAIDHQKELVERRKQVARNRYATEFDYVRKRQEVLRENVELVAADKVLKKLEDLPVRVKVIKAVKERNRLKKEHTRVKKLFDKRDFDGCKIAAEKLLGELEKASKPKRRPRPVKVKKQKVK